MTQETDYPALALSLLLQQYKESGNLTNLLTALATRGNTIEQAAFELRDLFYLDTAEGPQLDTIGAIFATARAGRTDTDYRQAIRAAWALRSTGISDDVIRIVKTAYGGTYCYFTDAFPAGFFVWTDASMDQADLDRISPAGVQGVLMDDGLTYLMDNDGATADDSNFIVDSAGFPIILLTVEEYPLGLFTGEMTLFDDTAFDVLVE